MIPLSVILPPVAGWLLGPLHGAGAMLLGGLAAASVAPQSAFFGFPTALAPAASGLSGALNRRGFTYITSIGLLMFIGIYSLFRYATWWFILPHLAAAVLALAALRMSGVVTKIAMGMFAATMVEQAVWTLMGLLLLKPSPGLAYAVFPLMVVERTLAVVASTSLALALTRSGVRLE